MHLTGIDDRDRSRAGGMFGAAVVINLSASLDDGHNVGVVPMPDENVLAELRRQQFAAWQEGTTPISWLIDTVRGHALDDTQHPMLRKQ